MSFTDDKAVTTERRQEEESVPRPKGMLVGHGALAHSGKNTLVHALISSVQNIIVNNLIAKELQFALASSVGKVLCTNELSR